jgi:hypothetical protein
MTTNYALLAPSSRVWIYQSNRTFSHEEELSISEHLKQFAQEWVSHNKALLAFAEVFYRQFIVLMVDETKAGASGCSIDSSVHFLQQLATHYEVDLFDRMTFAYQENGTVKTANRDEFVRLFETNLITLDTLVFDNLVATKESFDSAWLKPLKNSWHVQFIQ